MSKEESVVVFNPMKIAGHLAIRGYQKFISPYKGYCCAHKYYTKGDSCSEHVRKHILEHGLWSGLKEYMVRTQECRKIHEENKDKIHDCGCKTEEIDGQETLSRKPQGSDCTKESCNCGKCSNCKGCNNQDCRSLPCDGFGIYFIADLIAGLFRGIGSLFKGCSGPGKADSCDIGSCDGPGGC